LAASRTGVLLGMVITGLVMMCFTRMGTSCLVVKNIRYHKQRLAITTSELMGSFFSCQADFIR
jgi:hypothetical protein